MKIQDIVFLIVFILLFLKRDPRWFIIAGIGSLILAIPLFYLWIFFSAQRLMWYAAGLFFTASMLLFFQNRRR